MSSLNSAESTEQLLKKIQMALDKYSDLVRKSGVLKQQLLLGQNVDGGEENFSYAVMSYFLGMKLLLLDFRKRGWPDKHVEGYRDCILNAIDSHYFWEKLKPVVPEFREIHDDGVGAIIVDPLLNQLKSILLQEWEREEQEKSGLKEVEQEVEQAFYNLPSTPATTALFNLFGFGSDLWENPKQVVEREKALDTHKKLKIEGDATRPEILRFTIATRSALQIYEVDRHFLEGTNAGLKKIYSFIQTKVTRIFSDGIPVKTSIEFPLRELVDSGVYKTLDTARKGFLDAGEALIRVGIKGWLKLSNKKRYEQVDVGSFFTLFRVKRGVCVVKINPDFAWGMFTAFYTPFPPFAYKLSSNAFTLISLIFTIARQRWGRIGKADALKFQIKMRHIQTRLNLPDEDKTRNPRRDIRDVIENAIEEIERASNTTDFTMISRKSDGTLMEDNASISAFLAGHLEIELRGDYSESFKTIAVNSGKRIKAAQKRKEQSLTKGEIMNNSLI